MSDTTKASFIAAATKLFAERGFYGVSIAAIADELGLTKQALLHHFGSKERIYRDVLESLGTHLIEATDTDPSSSPAERLEQVLLGLAGSSTFDVDAQRLVIRELLDNRARLPDADTWYLKPYLDRMIALYRAIPGFETRSEMQALAAIYQIIGAVSYFEISQDTLQHMYGAAAETGLATARQDALRDLIRNVLAA